jgi:hypothetical protein
MIKSLSYLIISYVRGHLQLYTNHLKLARAFAGVAYGSDTGKVRDLLTECALTSAVY